MLMEIDLEKQGGLVPAIIQDSITNNVLMLGYMNQEAYEQTIKTGKVTFWSRSRQCLWTKGETSGNFLNLVSIKSDCDNDTLLVRVNPVVRLVILAQTHVGARRTRPTPCCSLPSCKTSSTSATRRCPRARILHLSLRMV